MTMDALICLIPARETFSCSRRRRSRWKRGVIRAVNSMGNMPLRTGRFRVVAPDITDPLWTIRFTTRDIPERAILREIS